VRPTFHLAPVDAWSARDGDDPYRAPSLDVEGFIHCTDGAAAMVETANRFYAADPRAFVVLTLDLDALSVPWRYDDPEQRFPHVYGALDPAAVMAVTTIPRTADGTFLQFGR
jgi:hypothetical protein